MNAIKKGLVVLKSTIPEFITGYALTELFSTIVFFPAAIIFILDSKFDVIFPEYVWYIVLVYIALSWSLSFYMLLNFIYGILSGKMSVKLLWNRVISCPRLEKQESPLFLTMLRV